MKYINKYKIHLQRVIIKDNVHRVEFLNNDGEWAVWSANIMYFDNINDALYLRHEEELFDKTETIQLVKHGKTLWSVGFSE